MSQHCQNCHPCFQDCQLSRKCWSQPSLTCCSSSKIKPICPGQKVSSSCASLAAFLSDRLCTAPTPRYGTKTHTAHSTAGHYKLYTAQLDTTHCTLHRWTLHTAHCKRITAHCTSVLCHQVGLSVQNTACTALHSVYTSQHSVCASQVCMYCTTLCIYCTSTSIYWTILCIHFTTAIKSCIGTSEKFRQTQTRLNPVGRNSTEFRSSNGGDRSRIRT